MLFAKVHSLTGLPAGACLSEFSFYAAKDSDEIVPFYDIFPQSLLCACWAVSNLQNSLRMSTVHDSSIAKDRYQVQIYN